MWKNLWTGVLRLLIRAVLSLRYRLIIKGLDQLTFSKKGGVLFLPNHPAEIDPVLLTLILWKRFHVHPLVVEPFYYLKGAHYFQKLVGAVPLPDLSGLINRWKEKRVEKCLKLIEEGLNNGKNYMIYPSGRLKVGPEEVVGGSSFVYNLIQESPQANIVLVRTTGLWGSRFSKALTGVTPTFGREAWEGMKIVLKNLIFFVPRRTVTIEFESIPSSFLLHSQRLEFNQALEGWYNKNGPEPIKLVSEKFWTESFPKMAVQKKSEVVKAFTIAPEVEKEITDKIAQLAKQKSVSRSDNLAQDLGLDSLDISDVQTFLIVRYHIHALDTSDLQTVEDILRVVANPPDRQIESHQKTGWPQEKDRLPIIPPLGTTIHTAFLKMCDRMGKKAACADARLGVISYRKLKLIALTLSHYFRKMEGDHVGVLLPSTTVSYVVVLALLLAGKTPVMLNWTVGARALNHCKAMGEFKAVISSRAFLEQLPDGDLGDLDDSLLYLEDIKAAVSLCDKLKAVIGVFKNGKYCQTKDDTAVILFTSGTEALPKGVPLTHENILSNQSSALSCVEFFPSDVLYGALPPFHSFGFTVTGLLPLLVGLKVYYAPDPTQYFGMAHDIEQWDVSLLCSAPTFMKGLFQVAKPQQLRTVRLAVGGAEKVSDELFEYASKMKFEMLEGYGITECSPVVSLTRPGMPREGVGMPIPNVEVCVINLETHQKLPVNTEGEICIRGPNVFKGYLGSQKSPFIELEGVKWYRSGDFGSLSKQGALLLSGRLKRFIKIGGEMVSLMSIEVELLSAAQQKGWIKKEVEGPPLAVAVSEKNGDKPEIVVFSTFDISKDLMNDVLRESGFGRIIKISEVRKVDKIPITGTGKVHLKALQDMI